MGSFSLAQALFLLALPTLEIVLGREAVGRDASRSSGIFFEITSDLSKYSVIHSSGSGDSVLFEGSAIAVFAGGKWNAHDTGRIRDDDTVAPLVLLGSRNISGIDPVLGNYTGIALTWNATAEGVPFVTTFQNFVSGEDVLFKAEFPQGATETSPVRLANASHESVLCNWPAFTESPVLPGILSWEGSFVHPKISEASRGATGGPTVFYEATGKTTIIAGPWGGNFKSFSAGDSTAFDGSPALWAAGTAGTIRSLPKGYTQGLLLHYGEGGITETLGEWGTSLKESRPSKGKKVPDLTLKKVGYQTDNGAGYCFCEESNCSAVLINELQSLDQLGVPMGYISFQGAGASSGRGTAAPWCVYLWGPHGGLGKRYPMPLDQFHEAVGVPLQLYAPYFCPGSPYFNGTSTGKQWNMVSSDTTLPGCGDYAFEDVAPDQSREFYDWFFASGKEVGMFSFEPDFMNQNYNCVPDFIETTDQAHKWQMGMADAALAANVTVQWCYATPTDVLAAVDMPAVTNFRVSNDYCYGRSWDIGTSSMLVWALGAAPSKDTLWTTDNHHYEVPGCDWTPDHETPGAELHVVLALMSTGPVGISDKLNSTNAALLSRALSPASSILLSPLKPATTVNSAFVSAISESQGPKGVVYVTHGLGPSWMFISFKLTEKFGVPPSDFYPALPGKRRVVARIFDGGVGCVDGEDALASGCVMDGMEGDVTLELPASDFFNTTGGTEYRPAVSTVWSECPNHWILLGELSKYVALSDKRFSSLECLESGVSTNVTGSVGEKVELWALQPVAAGDGSTQLIVKKKNVVIGRNGSERIVFESG